MLSSGGWTKRPGICIVDAAGAAAAWAAEIFGGGSSAVASAGSGCDAEFAAGVCLAGDGLTAGFAGCPADNSGGASVRSRATRKAAQPARQRPVMSRVGLFIVWLWSLHQRLAGFHAVKLMGRVT
jgi:hypothetical protein